MKNFSFIGDALIGDLLIERLTNAGYTHVESLESAHAVFVYDIAPQALEEIYFGEQGVYPHLQPGSCLINLGVSTPDLSREISDLVEIDGVHFIDAPLFFAEVLADARSCAERATMVVSADEKSFELTQELLQATGFEMILAPEKLKACALRTSLVCYQAGQLMSVIESLSSAELMGLDTATVLEQIKRMGATQSTLELTQAMTAKNFVGGLPLRYLIYTYLSACQLTEDENSFMPVVQEAAQGMQCLLMAGADKLKLNLAALYLIYLPESEGEKLGLNWAAVRAQVHAHEEGSHACDCGEDDCHCSDDSCTCSHSDASAQLDSDDLYDEYGYPLYDPALEGVMETLLEPEDEDEDDPYAEDGEYAPRSRV